MTFQWKKAVAASAITLALVGGSVTAAQAFYIPGTNISVNVTRAGNVVKVTVKNGTFTSGRVVTIRVPRGLLSRFGDIAATSATDAVFTVTPNDQGGVDPFELTLPEGVAGDFTLSAEQDGTVVSSTFTVGTSSEGHMVVSQNGFDAGEMGLWIAGGAVAAAGLALAGASMKRNRRSEFAV